MVMAYGNASTSHHRTIALEKRETHTHNRMRCLNSLQRRSACNAFYKYNLLISKLKIALRWKLILITISGVVCVLKCVALHDITLFHNSQHPRHRFRFR